MVKTSSATKLVAALALVLQCAVAPCVQAQEGTAPDVVAARAWVLTDVRSSEVLARGKHR